MNYYYSKDAIQGIRLGIISKLKDDFCPQVLASVFNVSTRQLYTYLQQIQQMVKQDENRRIGTP